jgi:hypothetical protein
VIAAPSAESSNLDAVVEEEEEDEAWRGAQGGSK